MTKLGEGELAVMTKTQGSVIKNIRAVRDFPSPKLCSITSEQEQWVKCNDFIVLTGNRKEKTQTFVISWLPFSILPLAILSKYLSLLETR